MSHGDVVTSLPPDAVVLAQNEHSPHQAFRLGDRIWGTQFHPEFTTSHFTKSYSFAGLGTPARILSQSAIERVTSRLAPV